MSHIRTTQRVVSFQKSFALPGYDAPQPAGEYLVGQDEEALESASRTAWRRVASFIHLPATSTGQWPQQMVPISPDLLEALIEKDQQQS